MIPMIKSYSNLKSKMIKIVIEKRCLTNHAERVEGNWQNAPSVQDAENL